jgi:hypothetical protein
MIILPWHPNGLFCVMHPYIYVDTTIIKLDRPLRLGLFRIPTPCSLILFGPRTAPALMLKYTQQTVFKLQCQVTSQACKLNLHLDTDSSFAKHHLSRRQDIF